MTKQKNEKRLKSEKAVLVKKNFLNLFLEITSGNIFSRGNFFFEKFFLKIFLKNFFENFFQKKIEKNCWKKNFEKKLLIFK